MPWTIINGGMQLFQRVEEALSMKYEEFLEDYWYFVVKEHDIESVCAKIKGKRDLMWQHFAIWDNKECPELQSLYGLTLLVSREDTYSPCLLNFKRKLKH
jgi:hypothetical protein